MGNDDNVRQQRLENRQQYLTKHPLRFVARGVFEPGYMFRVSQDLPRESRSRMILPVIAGEALRLGVITYIGYQIYQTVAN